MSGRRDAGRPRGKPIERAILAATLDEIAQHGPNGISVARIAKAAEVNKTTIYRRWPTTEILIEAAIAHSLGEAEADLPDTGSLQGDLVAVVEMLAGRLGAAPGRALMLAAMSERNAALIRRHAMAAVIRDAPALVRRAVDRGEWDVARADPQAVIAMLVGAVMHRVMLERSPADAAWVGTIVTVLTAGVAPLPTAAR